MEIIQKCVLNRILRRHHNDLADLGWKWLMFIPDPDVPNFTLRTDDDRIVVLGRPMEQRWWRLHLSRRVVGAEIGGAFRPPVGRITKRSQSRANTR
jgi:hypothetical protein